MATTYYVDGAVGSDGNTGANPGAGATGAFATIDKAMNVVAFGDKVWVKATGTYSETVTIDTQGLNGTTPAPIIFEGYTSSTGDGGVVTIDGATNALVDSLAVVRAYYVFNNFRFTGCTGDGVNLSVQAMFFKNCQFDTNGGDGIQVGQALFERCKFNNNTLHGAHIDSLNCLFIGCRFYTNTLDGLHVDGNGINLSTIVLFSEFYNNGGDAVETGNSNDMIVCMVGCTVDGNGKVTDVGLTVNTSIRQLVCAVNNVFYDCGTGVLSPNQTEGIISRNNLVNSNTANYSGFQTLTGEVTGAPSFVNEGSNDYTPASGSPLIGAGFDAAVVEGATKYMDIGARQSVPGAADYPSEDDVRDGVAFNSGGSTGNLELPVEDDVEDGVQYGTNGTEFTGTVVLPAAADVETGVQYGADGTEFTGTLVAATGGGGDYGDKRGGKQ